MSQETGLYWYVKALFRGTAYGLEKALFENFIREINCMHREIEFASKLQQTKQKTLRQRIE